MVHSAQIGFVEFLVRSILMNYVLYCCVPSPPLPLPQLMSTILYFSTEFQQDRRVYLHGSNAVALACMLNILPTVLFAIEIALSKVLCVYVCARVRVCVYVYVCMCMCVCVCVYVYLCMCVFSCSFMFLCACVL